MVGENLVEEIDWGKGDDHSVVIVGVKCKPEDVDKVTKAIKRALASIEDTEKIINRRVLERNRTHG